MDQDQARERAKLPAVRETLEAIAMGRMLISLDIKRRRAELEEFNGRKLRDPEFPDRKLLVSGGVTLYEAGYLTVFGTITDAGRAALAESA